MKVCRNCGKEFPVTIMIEGRRRSLSNRKYCLECSPFGQKNTKTLLNDPDIKKIAKYRDVECLCSACGRKYIYKRNKGHTLHRCNSCHSTKKRVKLKKDAVLLKGGKCIRCNYNRCLSALVFHHKDPAGKKITLANMDRFPWQIVKEELDKCILLCANCHAEEHATDYNIDWK